jgi:hypothetical protein
MQKVGLDFQQKKNAKLFASFGEIVFSMTDVLATRSFLCRQDR